MEIAGTVVLDTKVKLFSRQKEADFYYYLFSESGFEEQLWRETEEKENIVLLELEEIVEGKVPKIIKKGYNVDMA